MGMVGWVPAAGGSVLGIAFLLAMDALLPQLTPESFRHLGRRTPLLVLAVTLHNIPEGMAVGISFALASQGTPRPAHRRRRSGPGYRHPELPRGGCHRPASAPGRAQPGQILLDGGPVRRRGAHFRPAHRSDGRQPPAADALAALLCSRRHAVCGRGGADPGAPTWRTTPPGAELWG